MAVRPPHSSSFWLFLHSLRHTPDPKDFHIVTPDPNHFHIVTTEPNHFQMQQK